MTEREKSRRMMLNTLEQLAGNECNVEAADVYLRHTEIPVRCGEDTALGALHTLSTHQLLLFFVRCVVAAIPAAILVFTMYVFMLLLSSAFLQMLG